VINLKILFLADGSQKIGMGHIYRSLNLANELKNKNKILFLTREKLSYKIFNKKYKTFFVKKENRDKENVLIKKINPDLIIIDKLKERNETLKNISKICKNILLIDYIKKNVQKDFHGITMLYPDTGFSTQKNNNLKYAIINRNFSKNRISKINQNVKKIIILQGGSDTHCFTPKIIDSFNKVDVNFQITVVLGGSFNCWKKLNTSIKNSNQKIKILNDVSTLSSIFKKFDLAVTAGGMTLLELACVGLPCLIICGEKFEVETANLLEKNNFGKNLGFGEKLSSRKIAKNIELISKNFKQRQKMKLYGQKLVDGKGIIRVIDLINSYNFKDNSKF